MTSTNTRSLLILFAVALTLLGGCLPSGKFRPTRHFTLEPGGPAPSKGAAPLPVTAKVRRFSVTPRYDYRMTRRLSDVQLQYSEFDRWVETPDELVANGFYRALARSRAFQYVIPPEFSAAGDVLVEGRVMAFEGAPDNHAALTLALALRRESNNRVLWQKTLSRTAPMGNTSPAALAEALSKALDEMVAECVEEWRKLPELRGGK